MRQVGVPTVFWCSMGRIQITGSGFLPNWQGGGGGLTDE